MTIFGGKADKKEILSHWEDTIEASKRHTRGLPGIYASHLKYIQDAKLLDKGETKSKGFYEGAICAFLLVHSKNEEIGVRMGFGGYDRSPIAYCVSKLEELSRGSK